jgi:hypothetical protein
MRKVIPILLSSALWGVVFGQTPASSHTEVPVITVCDALHDLSRYNGKPVVIVARFEHTGEGAWLGENCEQPLVTDGYTWPSIVSTTYLFSETAPPPSVPRQLWDNKLLAARLKAIQQSTKLRVFRNHKYDDKWIAMYGRFETRLPPQLIGAGRAGFGFGHLNAAPAQLIAGEGAFEEWNPQKNSWVSSGSRRWPTE